MPEQVVVSDVELMSLIDGELDVRASRAVEAAIAKDPTAPGRLVAYARTRNLGVVFSEAMTRPLPTGLEALLATPPKARQARANPETTLLGGLLTARFWAFGAAMAGCLLVGTAAGWLASGQTGLAPAWPGTAPNLAELAKDGTMVAGRFLAAALETGGDGKVIADPAGSSGGPSVTVVPGLTFPAKGDRYCRDFTVGLGDNGHGVAGVACRAGLGQWRIEAQVATAAKKRPPSAQPEATRSGIAPASSPVIDQVISQLQTGDAFDKSETDKLIGNGWKKPQAK
jgi:surface antigen